MLVLTRQEGQWIEIRHRPSGDVVRFRCFGLRSCPGLKGRLDLAFADEAGAFQILRGELAAREPRP